jgi:hypothetical protein
MKIIIMSLALLIAGVQVFGQRKSKTDPKDAQIDTLTRSNKSLTLQLDSVSKELVKYTGMYSALKEKVIHYDFDPARTGFLIDSLKASRDSAMLMLTSVPKVAIPNDSIPKLLKEKSMLMAKIDSIRAEWEKDKAALNAEDIEKSKANGSLKQLKELNTDKIITDAEFIALKKKYLEKL